MPFERAASELAAMLGVQVSDSTVRRQALAAGAIWEQIQTEQAGADGQQALSLAPRTNTGRFAAKPIPTFRV
jgi:hypothetical protein